MVFGMSRAQTCFSWVYLWVFQLDVHICEKRTQREQFFCLNLTGSGRCRPTGVPFHSENFKCLIRFVKGSMMIR